MEIECYKAEIESLKHNASNAEFDELLDQIRVERETNAHLTSKLDDQLIITKKTEYAVQKLEELVNTKNLLIESLHTSKSSECENLTSSNDFQEENNSAEADTLEEKMSCLD